jgi:uncharacterized phage protein (TIGR02218 family)
VTKLVELFRFVEASTVYTQTSGANDVVYGAETYSSAYPIGRTAVEQRKEMTRAGIELKASLDNPVAIRYLANPVDSVVTLTVFRQEDGVTAVYWKGRLSGVRAGRKEVTLIFESVFTSLRRPGLRARYQRHCRHTLYARGCTLDAEDFVFNTTTDNVDNINIVVDSVDGAADNYYRGGMIRAPDESLRYILNQVGTTLTLTRPFETLQAAVEAAAPTPVAVKIYPGCPHTLTACNTIFGNELNFGGFPWIPTKNPYGGSSIA